MIQGEYISFTAASAIVNDDLIVKAETLAGKDITAKKLEIYTSGSLSFNINGKTSSTLFKDETGYYHLDIENGDVYVTSFNILVTTACPIFVSMIY